MKLFKTALLSLMVMGGTASANPSAVNPAAVVAQAKQAVDLGYGEMCSLEMKPDPGNPYYKCLDFGPYRIVFEYQRTRGFVILEDDTPVEVLSQTSGGVSFSASGPWEQDMAVSLAEWWNSTRSTAPEGGNLHSRAAQYIKNIRSPEPEKIEGGGSVFIEKSPPESGTLEITKEESEILRAIGSVRP